MSKRVRLELGFVPVLLLLGCSQPMPSEAVSADPPVRVEGSLASTPGNSSDVPVTPVSASSTDSTSSVPAKFRVKFETSKGDFVVEVTRDWAPRGADRFHELVASGFFDECRFFRVLDGFMAQFGINGVPSVQKKWRDRPIKDDPVKESNKRGYITYAMAGPNTRTTQLFINFGDNASLDRDGFSPFGRVIEGMKVVDSLYNRYGEGAPRGPGPDQGRIQRQGNTYLNSEFPKLDFIKKATFVKDES